MMREILSRKKTPDGRTIRVLECGHEQEEVRGTSSYAFRAHCITCAGGKTQRNARRVDGPVIGECTAIVMHAHERKARLCGKPAKYEKRGQPRCGFHFSRGAK